MSDFLTLPPDLPVPEDDGAADHLTGARLPPLELPSTAGAPVALADLGGSRSVLYVYPGTGRPGVASPEGWDSIPGARGCTPQACDFRDHHGELAALGADVHGLSSQGPDDQSEAAHRLHLPFPLLADPGLELAREPLRLPTFEAGGRTCYRRLTMIVRAATVEHVFYPVFPPDRHAGEVVAWLRAHPPT